METFEEWYKEKMHEEPDLASSGICSTMKMQWDYQKQEIDSLEAKIEKLRAGLESISLNTCCDSCQEAKLVARKTLKEVLGE